MNDLDLGLLKAITTNKKLALDFSYDCSEKVFVPDLWRLAKIIVDHIKVYKDVPTKRIIMETIVGMKNETFAKFSEEVLNKIDSVSFDEREYKHDLSKIKKRYAEKLIGGLKDRLGNGGEVNVEKSLIEINSVVSSIKNMNQAKSYKTGSLKDYVDEFKTSYSSRLKNPELTTGIKTGYDFIDGSTNGLKKSELLLLAGVTAAGKSLLLMNIAISMWLSGGVNTIDMTDHFKPGCNILLFSLEMSYEDYMERILARLAMVPQANIRDATLSDDEKSRVGKALKFIKNYPHSFEVIDLPKNATIEVIEGMCAEARSRGHNPDVIVVDYLNLMSVENSGETQDWLLQARLGENLFMLSRTLPAVVLSAIQLNPKAGEKSGGNTEYGISSVRRSTQIIDNCSMFAVINTRKNEANFPDMSISVLKNRRGFLSKGTLIRKMECCALLNSVPDGINDIEDISDRMVK